MLILDLRECSMQARLQSLHVVRLATLLPKCFSNSLTEKNVTFGALALFYIFYYLEIPLSTKKTTLSFISKS